MKYIIYLLFLTVLPFGGVAQQDYMFSQKQIEQELLMISRVLHNESILDSLIETAVSNSNLLNAFDEDIRYFNEEIKQNKRSWISSLRMGVNVFSANTTTDNNNESVTTYGVLPSVGINLSLDPGKLINQRSAVKQSISRKDYSEYLKEDRKMILKKDILNLYYDYLGALETVNTRQLAYNARIQQEEYTNGLFSSGEIGYSELLIAENQVYLAKEAWINAGIDAMKKRSEITVLLGLK